MKQFVCQQASLYLYIQHSGTYSQTHHYIKHNVYVFTDSSLHKTQCVRIHRLITTYAVWMYPQINNYKNTMCTNPQTNNYIKHNVYVFTDSSLHTQCGCIHRLITQKHNVYVFTDSSPHMYNTLWTYSQNHHNIQHSVYVFTDSSLQTIQCTVYVFTVSSLYTKHCVLVYSHNIVTVYVYIITYTVCTYSQSLC